MCHVLCPNKEKGHVGLHKNRAWLNVGQYFHGSDEYWFADPTL